MLAGFTLFGKFLRNKSEILPVATWSKLVCQILNNCQNELVILSPSKGQESDLHFILHIQSDLSEQTICQLAKKHGLQMTPLSRYCRCQNTHSDKDFIVNYANITSPHIDKIINILLQIIP